MKRSFPFLLFLFLIGGILFAQDPSERIQNALKELVRKADEGDAKSIYELAKLHDMGFDTIAVDSLRSTALYQLAAEKGYSPAMNFIGFRYYNGDGLRQNTDSALYWIRKAAEAGDVTAAANLGFLLTEGDSTLRDDLEAVKWLEIGAEGGVTGAQMKLVDLMTDSWRELPQDSLLKLGLKYYLGNAPIVGVKMFEIAAEGCDPKALALMGDAYSKGLGVPYDHQKSVDYFYSAAEAGDPAAQFIVAELLEFFPDSYPTVGSSISDSQSSPSYWYEKAASAGVTDSPSAYHHLYTSEP